ncbi:MAG: 23S rRNA (uracil(1939)-C(5))-methyltransferase RlmD, partial [Oscillospiraceae bacterium]
MDFPEKNQILTARVEGLNSQGQGVCRINGRAVFVPGGIPGELWEIKILKVTASAVYAKGLRMIEASPDRITPPCPVYGKCGGCSLMHMSYTRELQFKLGKVNEAIRRIGGLSFEIDEILGDGSRFEYRNKAIYAVGDGMTGFFRGHSHDIVPVEKCLIQSPIADSAAAVLKAWMQREGITAYDEATGRGCVRHIFVRTARKGPGAVACVVTARGLGAKTAALAEALRKGCPALTGIVLNVNKSRGNTVLAGNFYTLWGSEILTDELCGLKFDLSPLSFFQINPAQAEKLYARAVDYAAPNGGTVLDLYCGAGTISLCLAAKADKVIGAEIVAPAIENAKMNAEKNGVENAEFICADAGEVAEALLNRNVRPDAVVLDPPRKGLSPQVIAAVCGMGPQRVVYVSCDPATMARDLAIFAKSAYSPQRGTAVDMFPCTSHV